MSKIEGLDSLLEKLDSLGGNAEKTLYKAVKEQGKFIQGEAKDNVRVDTGSKGENTPVKDKYPGELSYHKGPWFIYENMMNGLNIKPVYVENIPFFIGKDGKKMYIMNRQPAQPFLYPALKNNREKIIEGIGNEVKKSIKEISRQ